MNSKTVAGHEIAISLGRSAGDTCAAVARITDPQGRTAVVREWANDFDGATDALFGALHDHADRIERRGTHPDLVTAIRYAAAMAGIAVA